MEPKMTPALLYCCAALLAGIGIILILIEAAKEIRRDKAVMRRRALMARYGFSEVRGTREIKDWRVS